VTSAFASLPASNDQYSTRIQYLPSAMSLGATQERAMFSPVSPG